MNFLLLALIAATPLLEPATVEINAKPVRGKMSYKVALRDSARADQLMSRATRMVDPLLEITTSAGARSLNPTRAWDVRIVGLFGQRVVPTVMNRYFVLPVIKEALDDKTELELLGQLDETYLNFVWSVRMKDGRISYRDLKIAMKEAASFYTSGDSQSLRVCYAEGQGKLNIDGMPQHASEEEYGCQIYTFAPSLRDDAVLSFDGAPAMVTIASRRQYARMWLTSHAKSE
ncbi:hypothetical protein [Duganella sp. HH101]|uniref:hypothetical protein n=1 Tax=Duganella sp. HH101 TaxID=1781066 RepID=UPI000874F081|nr:hypothetical protein [Duganella sp. HH101]